VARDTPQPAAMSFKVILRRIEVELSMALEDIRTIQK
jgi:hypothetical protein